MAGGSQYELKKSNDGQFMFNLKAGNGEVILTREPYKQKASAEKGIESVKSPPGTSATSARPRPTAARTSSSRRRTARSSARARCTPRTQLGTRESSPSRTMGSTAPVKDISASRVAAAGVRRIATH